MLPELRGLIRGPPHIAGISKMVKVLIYKTARIHSASFGQFCKYSGASSGSPSLQRLRLCKPGEPRIKMVQLNGNIYLGPQSTE